MKKLLLVSAFTLSLSGYMPAMASDSVSLPHQHWSFDGAFGTYDRAALQRGFQVYKQVCSACHSMKRVSYRNLSALGYNEDEIKAIAADAMITDGPNDEGEMFERPGRPSDKFKSPFANDKMAQYANNGALPPDLSLITKARPHGADYIFALLTGYGEAPAGEELLPGQNWNKYFAGHKIAMAPPLSAGSVAYEDGTDGTVEQYAKDLAQFLTWAAEPEMEVRKQTGLKAILFLAVFALIMYRVKRKVWAKAH
jgi:ubiquinol-cytochrome c reductase cytochrome c1 subunit